VQGPQACEIWRRGHTRLQALTLVEVRQTLRRAVTQGVLDEVSSGAAFDAFAQAPARWGVLEISREVAERAERLPRGARADAQRLAVAGHWLLQEEPQLASRYIADF